MKFLRSQCWGIIQCFSSLNSLYYINRMSSQTLQVHVYIHRDSLIIVDYYRVYIILHSLLIIAHIKLFELNLMK